MVSEADVTVRAPGSDSKRRNTVLDLGEIKQQPLRDFLKAFDDDGNGKIDIMELQLLAEYHRWWKWSAKLLFMLILVILASVFGLTNVAILLTKDMGVQNGLLASQDTVIKTSVAHLEIPLSFASLLDARHLDGLESLKVVSSQGHGEFSAGVYVMGIASYAHANETYIRFHGYDGGEVVVNHGVVFVSHPKADREFVVCGSGPTCSSLAVDVDNTEYLQQLHQRAVNVLGKGSTAAQRRRLTASTPAPTQHTYSPYCVGDEAKVASGDRQTKDWIDRSLTASQGRTNATTSAGAVTRSTDFCTYKDAASFKKMLKDTCGTFTGDAKRRCVNYAMHKVQPEMQVGNKAGDSGWWEEVVKDADNWIAMGIIHAKKQIDSSLLAATYSDASRVLTMEGKLSSGDTYMKWSSTSWATACDLWPSGAVTGTTPSEANEDKLMIFMPMVPDDKTVCGNAIPA